MGFKKGWVEYKKTQRATVKKRKASSGKKTSKSSTHSTKASNLSTGGRKMDKIGAMVQKAKLVADFAAPAVGTNLLVHTPWEEKAKNALRRYAGYDLDTGGFNVDWAKPGWQGMIVSVAEDYVDGKTGHAAGLSRYAIADVIEEAIPMLRAHIDASGTFQSTTNHLVNWTKYRTGYCGAGNTFDIARAREFLIAKGARIVLRKSGIASKINRRLPKGLNI